MGRQRRARDSVGVCGAHVEEPIERHSGDEVDEEPRARIVCNDLPKVQHGEALTARVVIAAEALEEDVESEDEVKEVVDLRQDGEHVRHLERLDDRGVQHAKDDKDFENALRGRAEHGAHEVCAA